MKFYFDRKVLIGFIVTLAVLITLGVLSFSGIQRLIHTTALLTLGLSVISNGDMVLKSVLELEAGERGYVISGDTSFLNDHRSTPKGVGYYLHKIDSLTSKDSVQHARYDTLRQLIERKQSLSDSLLIARKSSLESASVFVTGAAARALSDDIRSCIRRLQLTEGDNFRSQNTIKGNSLQQFQLSFVGLALACTVIILYLFYIINKTLKQKNEAQEMLRQSASAKQSSLEAELADADEIYRSLSSNIPGSAVTVLDRNHRYMLAEGDLLETMGLNKNEMPGKHISELVPPVAAEYYKDIVTRVFAGEKVLVERKTLSGIFTLMKIVPLRRKNNDIFAIMFVLIDITAIKRAQVELEELNAALEVKISQRTEQLKETNKQLEAFTYSVSHDLRAPLRAISGYAQILTEDYAESLDEEGRRINSQVLMNAKRMGKLIDDLLDFSRINSRELLATSVDMSGVVHEIIAELTASNLSRQVDVQFEVLQSCFGDVNLLRQVWFNLLSNAFKYTSKKANTVIQIGSEAQGDMVHYWVKDNGAGFDMQYKDKLFGVFQRLHKATEFEGTGVGLALVKTIVLRHGGSIWADSVLGQGAEFHFTMPAKRS